MVAKLASNVYMAVSTWHHPSAAVYCSLSAWRAAGARFYRQLVIDINHV
jgi:hypothetical protein